MAFDIVNFFPADVSIFDKCNCNDLYWPNTIDLSLVVFQSRNIIFLLHTLPNLEHLSITIAEPLRKREKHADYGLIFSPITLVKSDFLHSNTHNIRSLQLHHISLGDLLLLLSLLDMPLLTKLILIDVHDDSKW